MIIMPSKNKVYIILVMILLAALFPHSAVEADKVPQDIPGNIYCRGQCSWNKTLTKDDYVANNSYVLLNTLTSKEKQATLSVDTKWPFGWVVTVSLESVNWPQDLTLYVKRTGNGEGGFLIGGTKEYTQVQQGSGTAFFGGIGKRVNSIPVQFKVEGLSSVCPPQEIDSDITYTLKYFSKNASVAKEVGSR